MGREGQDTQHLSALGRVKGRFFLRVLIALIYYSNLVLYLKAYHILTLSSRLSKQANLTGKHHEKSNDITNHRIAQELFPSNSYSGPLEIILHLM